MPALKPGDKPSKQLNSHFRQQKYRINEVVYNLDASADIFYILLSGKLTMETEIEVDE